MATTYEEHLLFGGLLSLLAFAIFRSALSFTVEAAVVSVFFVFLAAIFPDIDHQGSRIHRLIKSFITVAAIAFAAALAHPNLAAILISGGLVGAGVAILFSAITPKHRGITHSVTAAILFTLVTALGIYLTFHTLVPALFTFVSYVSHLILDGTLFKVRK